MAYAGGEMTAIFRAPLVRRYHSTVTYVPLPDPYTVKTNWQQ